MKKVVSFFFLLAVFSVFAEERPLSFDRPVRPGDYFQAEITLLAQREYKFTLNGPQKPIMKLESVSLTFFGAMKVLEVNPSGNPSQLELRVANISGILNGKKVDSASLNGQRIYGDLRKFPVKFYNAVTRKSLPRDTQILLSALFHVPAGNSLKDSLGSELVEPSKGKRWRISALPVMEALQKRGFQLTGDSILADAAVESREKFRKTDCWRISVNIASKDVQTLDFRLKAELWIPVDPNGNVIRMIRTGTEVVDRPLPPENPLAEGSGVRVITNERLEAILIPAKEPPPAVPRNSGWSDFLLQ